MLQYEEICGWGSSNALKYLWWGENINEKTCREWFQRFKNGDFDVEGRIAVEEKRFSKMQNWRHYLSKTRVKIKKNWHDHCEWLNKPKRLKAMGMIQKQGNWGPYEFKQRDVERRLFACEQLLEKQRRKGFLHRIVTGDEKWVHYDNSKRRKSWEFPAMLPRRRPNRKFTAPRSCSAFGGTSSA